VGDAEKSRASSQSPLHHNRVIGRDSEWIGAIVNPACGGGHQERHGLTAKPQRVAKIIP
jgi:hypothetical protein